MQHLSSLCGMVAVSDLVTSHVCTWLQCGIPTQKRPGPKMMVGFRISGNNFELYISIF